MGLRLNFADTDEPKEGGFDLMPSGKYMCQIIGVEETETGENSKEPGTPMVKLELIVQDGKYEGRHLWDNLVLGDSSLWKTKLVLYALGYTKEEVSDPDFEFEPEEMLLEKFVQCQVGKQAAKGDYDARNVVKSYSAAPMTDDVV